MMDCDLIPRLVRAMFATLVALPATVLAGVPSDGIEWRLLGPAASWHMGSESAEFVTRTRTLPNSQCTMESVGVGLYPLQPGADTAYAEQNGLSGTPCQMASFSNRALIQPVGTGQEATRIDSHTDGTTSVVAFYGAKLQETKRVPYWHAFNPALGFERAVREGDVATGLFAGYARDSYGMPSVMAGINRRWTLVQPAGLRLEAGLTAGVWWRSELVAYMPRESGLNFESTAATAPFLIRQHLDRVVIPLILPMLSLEHIPSGVALNVTYAPRLVVKDHIYNAINVLMFQSTYRF